MSEGRGDKSTSRSRSLGVMEGKGFYSKHSLSQGAVRVEDRKRPLAGGSPLAMEPIQCHCLRATRLTRLSL